MTDYTVKIKGDLSDLIKKVQKANGAIEQIGKDEVKIKLDFENGNIEDLRSAVQAMIDHDEGLRIQLNYDLQSEALKRAKEELKDMQYLREDLKLAVELDTASIDGDIMNMADNIGTAIEKGIDEDILRNKLKRVLDIAYSVGSTKDKKGNSIRISDETSDYLDELTEKLRLDYEPKSTFFDGLDERIQKSETLVNGLQIQLEKLKEESVIKGRGGTGDGDGTGDGEASLDKAVEDARQYAQDAKDAADEAKQSADDARQAANDVLDAIGESSSKETNGTADAVKETTENIEELASATQAQADAQESVASEQQKLNESFGVNEETSKAADEINDYIVTLEKLQETLKQINSFSFKIADGSNEELGKNIEGTFKVYQKTLQQIDAIEKNNDDGKYNDQISLLKNYVVAQREAIEAAFPKDISREDFLSKYTNLSPDDLFGQEVLSRFERIKSEASDFKNHIVSSIDEIMRKIDESKTKTSDVAPEIQPEFIDHSQQIEEAASAHRDATNATEEHTRAEQELNDTLGDTPEFEGLDTTAQSHANTEATQEETVAQQEATEAYKEKAETMQQAEASSDQSEKAAEAAREEAEANEQASGAYREKADSQSQTGEAAEQSRRNAEAAREEADANEEAARAAEKKAKAEQDASDTERKRTKTESTRKTRNAEPVSWRVGGIKSGFNSLAKAVGNSPELTALYGSQIDEFQKKIQSITSKTTNEELNNLAKEIRGVFKEISDVNTDKISRELEIFKKHGSDIVGIFKEGFVDEDSINVDAIKQYSNEFTALKQKVQDVGEVFGEESDEYSKVSQALKGCTEQVEANARAWMQSHINSVQYAIDNRDLEENQTDRVNDAQQAVVAMNDIVKNLTIDDVFSVDTINSFISQLNVANEAVNGIKQNITDVKNLATETQVNKLFDKVNRDIQKNHLSGDLLDQFTNLRTRLREIAEDTDDVADGFVKISKSDFKGLVTEWTTLHRQMIETGQEGKTFFDRVGEAMTTQGAAFIARYFSFQDYIRYARELIQTVTTLDTSLKELQKLTGASDSVMAQSFQHASETAQQYGATINSVLDSTSDWRRLGYSLSESEDLAKVTTLYQNIANGIDQQNASEYMVSILQGFQIDASESLKVVDAINEVSQNFAIDQQGVGESLQRSAAAFNAAHTDLNKSIALVTASNEVLQDPAKSGTMWNTLAARIRGASTE